ncbi:beta-ketothiolase [Streptodolium elevatio]
MTAALDEAYLLAYVRTPRGKSTQRGGLASVTPLDLVRQLLDALVDRTGLVHTRGTSPSLADGACVALIGTAREAERLGITPMARIASSATAGADPVRMLVAGQTAVGCAIERAGLRSGDVDVVEYAEAFAALCVKIQRDLGFGADRFNVNGGTIAMGHAFGATGAILIGACADELARSHARYGVAAVSGAAGLGSAVVLEAVA